MESQGRKYHPHFNYEKLDFPETIFEQNRTLLNIYKGLLIFSHSSKILLNVFRN